MSILLGFEFSYFAVSYARNILDNDKVRTETEAKQEVPDSGVTSSKDSVDDAEDSTEDADTEGATPPIISELHPHTCARWREGKQGTSWCNQQVDKPVAYHSAEVRDFQGRIGNNNGPPCNNKSAPTVQSTAWQPAVA